MLKTLTPILLTVLFTGCGPSEPEPSTTATALSERFWQPAPAPNPVSVLDAHQLADSSETIAVTGRVSEFVETRAQFKLTDDSFTPCSEMEGETCATPWDYCCVAPDELAGGTVVIEFQEGDRLAKVSLKGYHGFDHLRTVVVEGRPKRDEAGNLTIVASGLHVVP